ncbi:hypothetical protein Lser_V15G08830 [Lactuca serriola]
MVLVAFTFCSRTGGNGLSDGVIRRVNRNYGSMSDNVDKIFFGSQGFFGSHWERLRGCSLVQQPGGGPVFQIRADQLGPGWPRFIQKADKGQHDVQIEVLIETIFMEQPPGFIDPKFPDHVFHLKKALYGLKHAPCDCRADTSLFVLHTGVCALYLLVYVDDLILTRNNPTSIRNFITRLHQEFIIKDLGPLSYFWGLDVVYNIDGLFLSQAKYAHDVLVRAGLLSSKPVATPLSNTDYLTTAGTPFNDPTTCRSVVGGLQYLTITRPDLSYVINQVSQFLHTPTLDHFQAVKCILRYVKGTISYSLTYDYLIFLGGNLVSWCAKKQHVSRSSCESEYRVMANTIA